MRTEQEVRDYLEFYEIERDDVLRICAYLEGKGIKLVRFTRTIIGEPKQLKYDDFVQWFNEPNEKYEETTTNGTDMADELTLRIKAKTEAMFKKSKEMGDAIKAALETKADSPEKPKYKKGDWVRVKGFDHTWENEEGLMDYLIGTPVQILEVKNLRGVIKVATKKNAAFFDSWTIDFEDIEPYEPKEGEFYVTKVENTFISHCHYIEKENNRIINTYWTCTDCPKHIIHTLKEGSQYIDSEHRPATEEEKQTLIKAVEDKYNKTYCEETKQWVDVNPKSAIDELNEKQEVRIKYVKDGGFNVYVGDFCTDFLTYDEMLGTVAALLTPPDIRERKCLHWLKTKEQHLASRCMSPELREEMGITDEEYEYEVICNR